MEGQGITGWTGVRMNLFTVRTLQADGKKESVISIPANQLRRMKPIQVGDR